MDLNRLLILCGVAAFTALLIYLGKALVARKKAQAFQQQLPATSSIRLLAFSTPECQQCKRLQKPAIQRVLERHQDIELLEINAQQEQELAQQFHILTVPSTVILDRTGKPYAINYGFANTERLLAQLEELNIQAA